MKIFSFLFLLSLSISGFAQISVGPTYVGKAKNFKKGALEKFKNTETIFILSETLDRYDYLKILEASWTITPYQIVHISDFDIEKYLSDDYSFATLGGTLRTMGKGMSSYSTLFTFIELKMYDNEKILKKLEKLSPDKKEKKKMEIAEEHLYNFAHIYIYPKDEFIHTSATKNIDNIFTSMYLDDVFYNYKPGFLKNYFQKVNDQLENGEEYWLYENDYLPELKKLASETLYIPSYLGIQFSALLAEDSDADHETIEDIFKNYDYNYEIIDDDELSDKIMRGEELYYIRYVRMNAERFLQVVNSKTGEIIYRKYLIGLLSFKIKPKHIKDLSKDISKARKGR
jgi:hypothetical protein